MNYHTKRLEYLRQELRAERISYGELAELQDLVPYIEPGDIELLEAAGVPRMTTTPKFPNVKVRLVGEDGNAFLIIGRTRAAMARAGIPKATIDAYSNDAMSGDYNHVLVVTMDTVTVS